MFKNTVLFTIAMVIVLVFGCKKIEANGSTKSVLSEVERITDREEKLVLRNETPVVGANRTSEYIHLLKGKKVGIVANQTSVIFGNNNYIHIVDSLLNLDVNIKKVYAPEHGFRGKADAGELLKDGVDTKTGLPILSIYGKSKKPSPEQLSNIDILVFDIQDVGARFYTYISHLHYIMEACAEQNIPLLILDRPNPNGHYIDGPILEAKYKSFIGMHPIPIVHGMTIGEYAQMINGEGWLKDHVKTDITVIPVENYEPSISYSLPIKPSPNLPNDVSINLYPSLCFFEGTNVSIGRGTDQQFQVVGSPFFNLKRMTHTFTPQPNEGAKYPKHQGNACHGYDLSKTKRLNSINLDWLIEFYKANQQYAKNETFFTDFFTKLAGTKQLQQQIETGLSAEAIKQSWEKGLEEFQAKRKPYLIYSR